MPRRDGAGPRTAYVFRVSFPSSPTPQTWPISSLITATGEPLDLSQGRRVWDQYEGQPASNVSKWMINTMVGDRCST
jgi:hypothetical protein